MTDRIMLGVKGASKGLWVSKPGYSVSSANPGDMLFDSSAQSYQVIASGSQFIGNFWAPSAVGGPPIYKSVALGIGSYSNVALWFDLAITIFYNSGLQPDSTYARLIHESLDFRASINGGTLTFSALNVTYYNQGEVQPRVDSNWFVFRSQYA